MHAACQSRGMHGILKALAYLRIVAVLTGILDYVNKCLVLQLVSNLTGNNTNMPRNPLLANQSACVSLSLLWQELHGPVLCDEN